MEALHTGDPHNLRQAPCLGPRGLEVTPMNADIRSFGVLARFVPLRLARRKPRCEEWRRNRGDLKSDSCTAA